VGVAGEAHIGRFGELALEHLARVGVRGLAFGGEDVAEHAGGRLDLTAPRKQLEGGRIGLQEHV